MTDYIQQLNDKVGSHEMFDFILSMEHKGATRFGIDISDYGFDSVPLCLYALKGKKLVGVISKAGVKVVGESGSLFSMKGREFLILN
jgi:hypothetical protein